MRTEIIGTRSRLLLAYSTVILVVVGCAVGPDYERPRVSMPPTYRENMPADTSIAGYKYWEIYGDPVLQSYIAASLDSNLDLLAAMGRIEEARSQVTITKADLFPSLGLSGTGGAFQLSKNRFPGYPPELLDGIRGTFGLSAVLSWELDVFGRIRRSTEAQKALLAQTEAAQRAAVVATVAAVAETYISLREIDLLAEILDSNLRSRREYVRLAETLFRGGKTSELDFRQAEAELARVEEQVPLVHVRQAQLENALNVLMARPPGSQIRRGPALRDQKLMPQTPSGQPLELLERRPDVVAAEQELIAANATIGVATAQLFPRIAISGEGGLQSLNANNLFDANSLAWQAAGNLTQPLFNAGRNLARVDAAEAATVQAHARYQSTVLTALQESNDAMVALSNSQARLDATVKNVEATREVLRLSELRYRYGTTPYLQVLDAQRSYLSAQQSEVSARADQLRSLIFLYRALGGGWQ